MVKNKDNSYFLERTDERSSWVKTYRNTSLPQGEQGVVICRKTGTDGCSHGIHVRRIHLLIRR